MATLCNVTGTVRDRVGQTLANVVLIWQPSPLTFNGLNGDTLTADSYTVTTGAGGTVDFDIAPGNYSVTGSYADDDALGTSIRAISFDAAIPDQAAVDLADTIEQVIAQCTPVYVQAPAGVVADFSNIALLQADTGLVYSTPGTGETQVSIGDQITTAGRRYLVAPSSATDHDETTAGGVKLYLQPDSAGITRAQFDAWAARMTVPDGYVVAVTDSGIMTSYVADSAAAVSGLPAGWEVLEKSVAAFDILAGGNANNTEKLSLASDGGGGRQLVGSSGELFFASGRDDAAGSVAVWRYDGTGIEGTDNADKIAEFATLGEVSSASSPAVSVVTRQNMEAFGIGNSRQIYNVLEYIDDAQWQHIRAHNTASLNAATITAGVQAAAAALVASNDNGVLYFPSGEYLLNGSIDLSAYNREVLIQGDGSGVTILHAADNFGGGLDLLIMPSNSGASRRTYAIHGLQFEGSNTREHDPTAINAELCQSSSVCRDLRFSRWGGAAFYSQELDNSAFKDISVTQTGYQPLQKSGGEVWGTYTTGGSTIRASSTEGTQTDVPGFFTGMVGAQVYVSNIDGAAHGVRTITAVSGGGEECTVDSAIGFTSTAAQVISFGPATASMTSGSATLTADFAAFTAGDVGRRIVVRGAGSHQDSKATPGGAAALFTTITGYTSATVVTLADNAAQTVSGQPFHYPFFAIGYYEGDRNEQTDKTNDVTFSDIQFEACHGAAYFQSAVNMQFNRFKLHGRNEATNTSDVGRYLANIILDTCYRGNVFVDTLFQAQLYKERVTVTGGGCGVTFRGGDLTALGLSGHVVGYEPDPTSQENRLSISLDTTRSRATTDSNPLVRIGSGVDRATVLAGGGPLEDGRQALSFESLAIAPQTPIGGDHFTGATLASDGIGIVKRLPINLGRVAVYSGAATLNGNVAIDLINSPPTAAVINAGDATDVAAGYVASAADAVVLTDGTASKLSVLVTNDEKLVLINRTGSAVDLGWHFSGIFGGTA